MPVTVNAANGHATTTATAPESTPGLTYAHAVGAISSTFQAMSTGTPSVSALVRTKTTNTAHATRRSTADHRDPHRPTRWLPKIAEELGLARLTPHGLRHSYSTAALKAKVDIKVLSERLGHANTAITRDLYQEALPEMDREAADTVAREILGG